VQEQDSLKLYFLIAPALYLVNTIIATAFALKYKNDPIYKKSAAIWFCYLILGIAQGALENSSYEAKGVAWCVTSFFACTAMSIFVSDIFKLKNNIKIESGLFLVSILSTLLMYKIGGVPFFIATLPSTFFASYPVLKLLPQLRFFKKNTFTKNGTLICYLLIALHGVDYAYFGDKPEFLFLGYLLALMLAIGASGFTFAALIERAIIEIEINELLQNTVRLTALGSMAAEISHEIKNPLTVLSLNNSQMKYKIMTTEPRNLDVDYFKNKTEVAERMLKRLIDIMNTLRSHYNSGAFDDLKDLKISDMFDEVKLMCDFRAQKNRVSVEFINSDPDLFVECRSVQVTQVLQNLIQNSMDVLENVSNPKITVRARDIDDDQLEISVSDNGPGIPADIRDKIFSSFFTTKPKDKGSGLGLSISKRFIEDHGGKLYLENSAQTTFKVILPKNHSVNSSIKKRQIS
jgi:signal transduction histidine kinase